MFGKSKEDIVQLLVTLLEMFARYILLRSRYIHWVRNLDVADVGQRCVKTKLPVLLS